MEPRERSHGQVDEARFPLYDVQKLHVPSEKRVEMIETSVLSAKWEIRQPARISKGGFEKSTCFSQVFQALRQSSEHFPPILKGSKVPRQILLKGFVTSAGHRRSTWEVATLENEFLGFLGVFLVLFLQWNLEHMQNSVNLLEYLSCFDLFKTLQVHGNINIGISRCTAHT